MTTNILGLVAVCLCLIPLLSMCLVGWMCQRAPRGYQDEHGYHDGEMPEGTTYYD